LKKSKIDGLRKFGIELVGDVPWGTHLCQFYQTKKDLVDVLVPYFKAGLEGNEFCMWVTAEPLEVEDAKKAMGKAVPRFADYLNRGQIEILSYKDWYVKGGKFDCDRVLAGWVSKLEAALKKGYDGLRLTGNTFWLEKKDWAAFTDYEEAVNNVISKYGMIAICTYSLDTCNANEIIDVIRNHQFALIKRSGKWELIESSEKKRIAENLLRTEQKLEDLYNSMTEGVALHEVIYDGSGKAVDYVILDVNPSFEKITGMSKKRAAGKRASELYGTGAPPYLDVYAKVAASGKPASFETYFPPMKKHFSISVVSPSKGKFNTIFNDITESKQAEEALRASEQRWATTLTSIGDAVIATDVEGRITFMNRVAENLTGCTLEESAKKPLKKVFKIINENTRKAVANPVAKVLEKGAIVGLANHTMLICRDGTEIPIDDSGAPIKDEYGEIIGVVLVFRDITERKKADEKIAEQAFMLANANDAIIGYNFDQDVTFWNKSAEKLYGYKAEEVLGKKGSVVLKPVYLNITRQELLDKLTVEGRIEAESIRQTKDGKSLDIEAHVILLRDGTGKPIGYVSVDRDITDRKRAEKVLRDLNERFEMAQRAAGVGVWDWDVKTGQIEWTPQMFKLFGLNPQKTAASFESWASVLHPEDRKKAANSIDEALKTQSSLDNKYRVIRPDGQVIWINALGQGEYDNQNQPIRMTGICIDITERKKAEEALKRQASLIDLSPDAIIVKKLDDTIVFWSQGAQKLYGWTKQEALGQKSRVLFKTKFPEPYEEIQHQLECSGHWFGEKIHQTKSGREITVESRWLVTCNVEGKIDEILETNVDITERKKTEEAIQQAKRDWEKTFDSVPDLITILDKQHRIVRANLAIAKRLGTTPEHCIGLKCYECVHGTGVPPEFCPHVETLKDGQEHIAEVAEPHLGGVFSVSTTPLKDDQGKLIGSVHVARDITKSKKYEKALQESQRDLKRAQEVAKTGSWRLDTRHNVLLWSDETYRIFGIPLGKPLTYETFLAAVHPEDQNIVNTRWNAALKGEPYDIEHRIIVDGEVKWVREKAELEFDENNQLIGGFGTVQNITKQKEMQQKLEDAAVQLEEYANQMEQLANERAEKLKDAERLAAIGATAGMVGHDIRNPLQAIVGNLYLVKSDLALMPPNEEKKSINESINDIAKNVDYINKIVQDLQDYARPLKPTIQETDFEELCKEVLFKNGVPDNISASYQVAKEAKTLTADPALLKRILSNLTNNAIQAMETEGGKLKIKAYKDKNGFILTVHDTGVGIPEEVKPNIFTPLFTTKSKGQGFGLAVVKRMTEALNGTVTFESEQGTGTTFTIRIPQKPTNNK
jgi:PAS domain S-box-containing protein